MKTPLHVVKAKFGTEKPVVLPGLPRFIGGAVGYVSYDIVRYFEKLPDTAGKQVDVPEAAFMLVDTLVIFDHAKHQITVMANARKDGNTDADIAYDEALLKHRPSDPGITATAPHNPNSINLPGRSTPLKYRTGGL